MDSDLIVQQFEQIEQKVEELIGTCRELEAENAQLKNQALSLEEELQRKQKIEDRYQDEKNLVRTRIDGLLAKLDTIAKD